MISPLDSPNSETASWIWQQPDWPHFHWDTPALAVSLREVTQLQGRLLGKVDTLNEHSSSATELDALLQNIIESSAIEGEPLNVASVRSSLAKRLGVKEAGLTKTSARSEGLAELLLDATQNYQQPLTLERLFQWHCDLFPEPAPGEYRLEDIRVGQLRGEDAMQVVSGPHHKRTVHFVAPPKNSDTGNSLEQQLTEFLHWLQASRNDAASDPILRAAQAHFWFITLHPFDDGNGRLARAISDYALAQAEHQSIRFYAMAAGIMEKRKEYYAILERCQKGSLDITPWMQWFIDTLKFTLAAAIARVDNVLIKSRFWQRHSQDGLAEKQSKVLNRLLDAGPGGFEGGLTARKYMSLAAVSKATATRHLAELTVKGCLVKLEGGGRSTRYDINWP